MRCHVGKCSGESVLNVLATVQLSIKNMWISANKYAAGIEPGKAYHDRKGYNDGKNTQVNWKILVLLILKYWIN